MFNKHLLNAGDIRHCLLPFVRQEYSVPPRSHLSLPVIHFPGFHVLRSCFPSAFFMFMIPVFTSGPLARLEGVRVAVRGEAGRCRLFSDGSRVPVVPPGLPWPGRLATSSPDILPFSPALRAVQQPQAGPHFHHA